MLLATWYILRNLREIFKVKQYSGNFEEEMFSKTLGPTIIQLCWEPILSLQKFKKSG